DGEEEVGDEAQQAQGGERAEAGVPKLPRKAAVEQGDLLSRGEEGLQLPQPVAGGRLIRSLRRLDPDEPRPLATLGLEDRLAEVIVIERVQRLALGVRPLAQDSAGQQVVDDQRQLLVCDTPLKTERS